MTDAKPGFGPNPEELSPMNIINPNIFSLTLVGP